MKKSIGEMKVDYKLEEGAVKFNKVFYEELDPMDRLDFLGDIIHDLMVERDKAYVDMLKMHGVEPSVARDAEIVAQKAISKFEVELSESNKKDIALALDCLLSIARAYKINFGVDFTPDNIELNLFGNDVAEGKSEPSTDTLPSS